MDVNVPLGAVLVGLDGSGAGSAALDWAAAEARRRHWPLHLMHVLDESQRVWPTYALSQRATAPVVSDALSWLAAANDGLDITWSQVIGDPATVLATAARVARLVVVESRGRGAAADAFLGSTTTHLIAQTHCPVAVLRADTAIPPRGAPVVVGLEYGRPYVGALETAFEQASSRHVDLIIVHTWRAEAPTMTGEADLRDTSMAEAHHCETDLLRRSIAEVARSHPYLRITTHAVPDGAVEALCRYAAEASLLVVGSRGHRKSGGAVLGSANQNLIRLAPCPVLVVRDGRKPLFSSSRQTAAGAS